MENNRKKHLKLDYCLDFILFSFFTTLVHKLPILLVLTFDIVPEPPIRSYLFRLYEIAAYYMQLFTQVA